VRRRVSFVLVGQKRPECVLDLGIQTHETLLGAHRNPTTIMFQNAVFSKYPFELSPFQKEAIQGILDGHHVLVTAHTGSGKTLPAEFAIEHFAGGGSHNLLGKKVVYTSPIKALSNQKYAEFSRKYPHISFGLFTGDIKTNPDAQVLIMTTEILMNALFKRRTENSSQEIRNETLSFHLDVERDLACVIFDEIHYINDADRGHVWEKTILMLPNHIQMVMLSATIDDPQRFATWIETTKSPKQVVLASTTHRVVPLTHYAYVTLPESGFKTFKDKTVEASVRESTQDLIPLLSPTGVFQELQFHKVQKLVRLLDDKDIRTPRKFVLNHLLLFLRDRGMLPAIFFTFSRKLVEACAQEVTIPVLEDDSKVGYTIARDCEQMLRKLTNFQEYLQMPEYRLVVGLLEKGIGIHHSGMIPILREMVELMIGRGKVKVLFATESFAIGLDCPIKTAVFTSLTKFDGQYERLLHAHEYTQMAGRAGRRGLDTVGHVVHCSNLFFPSQTEYRLLLGGKPQQLVSKFTVSYSLVLNLMSTTAEGGGGAGLTLDDCCAFANLSMRRLDMDTEVQHRLDELEAKVAERDRIELALKATLKTPLEVCNVYLQMERDVAHAVNKKRKTLERELRGMVEQYPTCMADAKRVADFLVLHGQVQQLRGQVTLLERHLREQLQQVLDILHHEGILLSSALEEEGGAGRYRLSTPLGTMAASLAEAHPVVLAQQVLKWNWLEHIHDVAQLVGILSVFTDVKVLEQQRRDRPFCEHDAAVKRCIQDVYDAYVHYETVESEALLGRMTQVADLNFSIAEWVMRWARCDDELSCRVFLADIQDTLGVSAGDFTKAMLKLSTVAKELAAMAETHCQLECLHKLSLVDGAILKYVATCQSLYV